MDKKLKWSSTGPKSIACLLREAFLTASDVNFTSCIPQFAMPESHDAHGETRVSGNLSTIPFMSKGYID